MSLLQAIREDHDPFAILGLFGGFGRFLFFFRWTSYACPHCLGVFRRDFWPHNVRLGNPEHICKKCGIPFDDGSREWPELRLAQRLRFFLPPGIQAMGGSLLFCGIFTLFIAPRDVVNLSAGTVVVLISLSPTLIWCAMRLVWILRSKNRFENDPSLMQRKMGTHGAL
jgi:hypothetical protein